MPLTVQSDARATATLAAREIVLWTTKDGREIPLDEMSDDHIANAIRVLSLWRQRLKQRGGDDTVAAELKEAISRFKVIERRRRKAARTSSNGDETNSNFADSDAEPKLEAKTFVSNLKPDRTEQPKSPHSSFGSRGFRPRKPVAKT
jgi:hypothetical protein